MEGDYGSGRRNGQAGWGSPPSKTSTCSTVHACHLAWRETKKPEAPGAVALAVVTCVPTLFRTLSLQRDFFDLGGRLDRPGDIPRGAETQQYRWSGLQAGSGIGCKTQRAQTGTDRILLETGEAPPVATV